MKAPTVAQRIKWASWEAGECTKCSGKRVIKKIPKTKRKRAAYHFRHYFQCPDCGTMFMDERVKYTD